MSLANARAKVARAAEHLESLEDEVEAFLANDPYYASVQPRWLHPHGGFAMWPRIRHAPPVERWAVIVGDFAHNLRSALNYIAWQVAKLETSSPDSRTQFPIAIHWQSYRSSAGRQLNDVTVPGRWAIFQWVQPCQCASRPEDHPLWLLARLSNPDKHVDLHGVIPEGGVEGLGINELSGFGGIHFEYIRSGSIEDHTPIAVFRVLGSPSPDAVMRMEPDFTCEIRFGDGEPDLKGKVAINTLQEMLRFVENVVFPQFEPLFA